MEKYASWVIFSDVATRNLAGGEQIRVALERAGNGVRYEGSWPEPPVARGRSTMLTGICLWDGRWRVEFEKRSKGNDPARRSLALPTERDDAYTKIAERWQVRKMYIPTTLDRYHRLLVQWQRTQVRLLRPERVLYHVPREEYHQFIRDYEELTGKMLPEAHEELDCFTNQLVGYIQSVFAQYWSIVELIHPVLQGGVSGGVESFVLPYLQPEVFGTRRDSLYGVEDLIDLRLGYEAWRRRGGSPVPVLCGVLDVPHPYLEKSFDGVRVLDLQ